MSFALRSALACATLAVLAPAASASIDRVVEKTFQVKPDVRVVASTSGGNIEVGTSADPVVRIVAKEHIRAHTDAEADEILSNLDLRIEQVGDEVVAKAEYKGHWSFSFGSWPPVSVELLVTAPRGASAELKTSGGDIVVGNLDGRINAHTSGGDLKLGRIGGKVEASTSGGGVQLEEGGSSANLSTSGGSILVGKLAGAGNLRTSGGRIQVDGATGPLDADTSGGSVHVVFAGPLKGDCSLSTSGGDIRATVGAETGVHIDAHTSGGSVSAPGLSIKIERSGDSTLIGDAGGGGPTLRMRTSGGDIEINAKRG